MSARSSTGSLDYVCPLPDGRSRFSVVNATDVVRPALLDPTQLDALRTWTAEVEAWPAGSHRWGHYAEHTARGPRICRTENVSVCHDGFASLVDGALRDCA